MLPVEVNAAGGRASEIRTVNGALGALCISESRRLTMIGKWPALAGVPDRTPPASTPRPPIVPVALQTNGVRPPFAVNCKLYGTPTVAVGGGTLLIVGGSGLLTVIVN